MKTAFVIQIVQLGEYGTRLANMELFIVLVFRILSRIYIRINDKI